MIDTFINFAINTAGPSGSSTLVTISSSVIALGVLMIFADHVKSLKKGFQLGFNKATGLLFIFLALGLMVISSWI